MMVLGGLVRGGLYGTAPNLNNDPANPTLENNAADVKYETDFRAVYAKILDSWLGSNSVSVLGADYRPARPLLIAPRTLSSTEARRPGSAPCSPFVSVSRQ